MGTRLDNAALDLACPYSKHFFHYFSDHDKFFMYQFDWTRREIVDAGIWASTLRRDRISTGSILISGLLQKFELLIVICVTMSPCLSASNFVNYNRMLNPNRLYTSNYRIYYMTVVTILSTSLGFTPENENQLLHRLTNKKDVVFAKI